MIQPLSTAQIAELRQMDLAHHLPAQSDYQVQQQLGGSRIIVRAEGCTITNNNFSSTMKRERTFSSK